MLATPHCCNSGRTAVGDATHQKKVSNLRRFILAFWQIYCGFKYYFGHFGIFKNKFTCEMSATN